MMKGGCPGAVMGCGQNAAGRPWEAEGGWGGGQDSPDPRDGLNAGGDRTWVSHSGHQAYCSSRW